MTSISKNVYIDKLDIEDDYNNIYHRTINIKPVDVKYIYRFNGIAF